MHIVLGLVVAFVIVALYARRRRTTRACRWRADRSRDTGGRRMYRCAACGAEALVDGDGPPDWCALPKD